MSIPVFKPSIKRRDMHSVLSCLVTDVIGPAVIADDLVATVAGDLGHEGGGAIREYVRAIELTIQALGLEPGDKALISPLAPGAYRRAFQERGIVPVFVDVKEEDACLDPASIAEKISSDVKVIFVHAPLGRVPDMAKLEEFGIPLIGDIGEALGATDGTVELGSIGYYVLLPMEPNGIATSGGGTLVLAKNKDALSALNAAAEPLTGDIFLPDLNASLGLVQWREYPHALEARETIADVYRQSLMKGRHRTLADPPGDARAVPYSFPVVLKSGMNEVRKYARKKGVETLPAFFGGIMEGYSEAEEQCPRAKSLMMSTLLFPLYPTLGKQNVQLTAKVLSTLP
jgi:perosamine synthetase